MFHEYTACIYPSSTPNIIQDFREITIRYNTSGLVGNISYFFDVKLANRPSYFVPFDQLTFTKDPNVTIRNLLSDETIKYRVAMSINGSTVNEQDYSAYKNVLTKKKSLAEVSSKCSRFVHYN